VAAAGLAAAGDLLGAGGFVFCSGATDGFVPDAATPSKESAQGSVEDGMVEGAGRSSCLRLEDSGQAGIVCSVGGSGGQMSVASGTELGAGATSSWSGIDRTCAISGASSRGSPGGAGTVWAQVGVGFCIGTASFGSASFSVLAQSGSVSF
jgi:hypothetical protein